ncbi:E3 ubiquitin-protein ligase CHFR [Phalaenopsis equestris]|uniref:E3 ubiquitin-protein ligase CHFR n=1 Tax=Phalaenopsis equestris TaxID=78828 RepID=UPI0009E4D338|nr:E3 ubiquitin-protein ligase CHFR [Phalaenopsis equestris]
MDTGQCSGSKEKVWPWAKLVPRDVRYREIEIRSAEEVICSQITDSSLDALAWCAIIRDGDDCVAIKNLSSTAILVDGNLVQEELVALKHGIEIIPGPCREGYMSYVFQETYAHSQDGKGLKISLDAEHANCSICLNIWHDVVTVSPCLHNFCNGCFSEWLRKSSTKPGGRHQSVVCPQCRAVVHSVGRNHFLHNIEEAILQSSSSLKRSDEELALADTLASINSNILLGIPKGPSRKRTFVDANDDGGRVDFPCPQCGTELEGFKCSQTTAHLQCHKCSGRMPSRPDIGVPQHCLGCNRAFCGAYWLSQGMDWKAFSIICSPETLKPISEHYITRIPDSVHQSNQYERDVTERCINETGKTLQGVLSEWFAKFINREIDMSNLQMNHPEAITARTPLCNGCYEKLVDYLLYWFRITLPPHLFPPDLAARQNCWYGYGCRTQHHNSEHARKRNHVCRQTKGMLT